MRDTPLHYEMHTANISRNLPCLAFARNSLRRSDCKPVHFDNVNVIELSEESSTTANLETGMFCSLNDVGGYGKSKLRCQIASSLRRGNRSQWKEAETDEDTNCSRRRVAPLVFFGRWTVRINPVYICYLIVRSILVAVVQEI